MKWQYLALIILTPLAIAHLYSWFPEIGWTKQIHLKLEDITDKWKTKK